MPRLYNWMKYLSFPQRFVLKLYPPTDQQLQCLASEYRYRLESPVKQDDPVLRFIRSAILKLEKEHMKVAASGFTIQPLTWSPPIWPLALWNAQHPTKLYAIKVRCEEFPSSILVSIEHRGSMHGLTMDRVMIQPGIDENCMPLKDFILQNANTRLSDIRAQQLWWKKMDKSFRILDLPAELREYVLLEVLGGQIRPHVAPVYGNNDTTVVLGSKHSNPVYERMTYYERWCYSEGYLNGLLYPNYAIFSVSKQIREEALSVGWQGTEKYFYCPHRFQDVLSCTQVPLAEKWLSKVTLVLDIVKLFELFGLAATDTGPSPFTQIPHVAADLLATNTQIEVLSIDFPNPHVSNQSPWYSFDGRFGCYMDFIDWILIAAFPYIKHIPTIELRGAIKSATKRAWDTIFRLEYKNSKSSNPGNAHGFDYATAMHTLMSMAANAM
jgi:hypothetical protein